MTAQDLVKVILWKRLVSCSPISQQYEQVIIACRWHTTAVHGCQHRLLSYMPCWTPLLQDTLGLAGVSKVFKRSKVSRACTWVALSSTTISLHVQHNCL